MGKAIGKGLGAITGTVGNIVGGTVGGLLNPLADALTAQAALLPPGVTQDQIDTAYKQSQEEIAKQNAFLSALQAQNGIGNQSSVFNQLQGVANGTGPNPAQAMLAQATGQNVANQAALMAGQRGASQNAGLIARQAAMQGGNLQQQAAGQAASMQAQQSLNALSQLGGIAGQQVAQQQNALTGANQFAQSQQQNLLNALGNANQANAGILTSNAAAKNKTMSSIGGGIGSVLGLAGGGEVPQYAHGAYEPVPAPSLGADINVNGMPAAPMASPFGLGVQQPQFADPVAAFMQGQPYTQQSREQLVEAQQANQPKKPLSPLQQQSEDVNKAGFAAGEGIGKGLKALFAAQGAMVPGKAKVKGDNKKNDNVPALLSPGEIVIPRSIAQSEDAPEKAAEFVRQVLAKKGRKKLS